MKLLKGVGEFFAIDVGTNSIRLAQLSGDAQRGWTLQKYAYVPVDARMIQDDSDIGKKKLGELIKTAVTQAGIKTKNIAVGVPARKTFTAVIDTPNQPVKELMNTVKYQLDRYIPMALDEAKVDYILLGESPNGPTNAEVLVSSTSSKFAEEQLDFYEGLGFNVVAFEPEPLAMARALMPVGENDAKLIVDLGEKSADIVVVYDCAPRLVRTIPGGFDMMVKTVAASLSVKEDQARQFILKFGLAQDKVDGQVFRALDVTLESFVSELVKSVKFFQSKYLNIKVGGIILSGYAEIIPFVAEYIEAKVGVPSIQGNPWQVVRVTPEQQQALSGVASEFAVAIGLAERSNSK